MSQKQIEEYLKAVTASEMDERARCGLPRDHALDMADFPFRFRADVFREFIQNGTNAATQNPNDSYGLILGVCASVLAGDYAQADQFMEQYAAQVPPEPMRCMRFSRRRDRDPISLPPVHGAWPSEPSLFISCDPEYLREYGTLLLRSVAETAPGSAVHVHVMGNAETPRVNGIKITTTSEVPPDGLRPKEYYAAVRFVRFAQALEVSQTPLLIVDVDGLCTADHRPLLAGDDAGLRVRAGRIKPWEHFSACCVRGTPQSLRYFQAVSDIVLRSISDPFWGIDQYALFAAYAQERPKLSLFGPDVASVVDDVPGVFWFTAGNSKLSLGTSNSPYAQLHRRYAGS
jgi:hypothetical protein